MNGGNALMDKRAAFLSLGCKVNSYETEAIKQSFLSYGCRIVDFKEEADIYIINTCTVTNIADRKSRQMLSRARKQSPGAIVVATGCYVQESLDELKNGGNVDIMIGNRLKNRIAQTVNSYILSGEHEIFTLISDDDKEYEELPTVSEYKNTRVDIKIQDGCNQFCSYCIIPYARGRISSRRPESVISEVRSLAKRGYSEVVLTGIHLSSYGLEDSSPAEQAMLKRADKRIPLVELIEELNKIEELERIRIGSVEPRIVTEDFVSRLAECRKLMPHFHLSLQSGCDTVLKRMNRRYTTDDYLKSCELLRTYYYKPSITTDIIAGFPGESEEEFAETINFVRKADFAAIHIFPYSLREGTRAANMPDQIDSSIKTERAARLSLLEKELRHAYEASFEGEIRPVLVEEELTIEGESYLAGHTPEYVRTVFRGSDVPAGSIVDVTMGSGRVNDIILSFQ